MIKILIQFLGVVHLVTSRILLALVGILTSVLEELIAVMPMLFVETTLVAITASVKTVLSVSYIRHLVFTENCLTRKF